MFVVGMIALKAKTANASARDAGPPCRNRAEIEEVGRTELHRLKQQVEEAAALGRDLLAEIAANLTAASNRRGEGSKRYPMRERDHKR